MQLPIEIWASCGWVFAGTLVFIGAQHFLLTAMEILPSRKLPGVKITHAPMKRSVSEEMQPGKWTFLSRRWVNGYLPPVHGHQCRVSGRSTHALMGNDQLGTGFLL